MIDVAKEKALLADFRRSLNGRSVLVIDGNQSVENLLYKDSAPDANRGIISIVAGLRKLGIDHRVVQSDFSGLAAHISISDIVLIYAHGEYGEDGRLQGWLDYVGKPYPGPGVLASALCLDKLTFKRVVSSAGLNTPSFTEIRGDDEQVLAAAAKLGYPLMMKLRTGGSSIGIHLVRNASELSLKLTKVSHDERGQYFLEKFIDGRFLTVGIVRMSRSDLRLPILEVCTDGTFYDEKTKLGVDKDAPEPKFVVPAPISKEAEMRADALSREAYRLTGCSGMARVDLMLDTNDVPWLLEINTIPGLAEKSNLTCAFMSLGFTYEELLLSVLRTAESARRNQDADVGAVSKRPVAIPA